MIVLFGKFLKFSGIYIYGSLYICRDLRKPTILACFARYFQKNPKKNPKKPPGTFRKTPKKPEVLLEKPPKKNQKKPRYF